MSDAEFMERIHAVLDKHVARQANPTNPAAQAAAVERMAADRLVWETGTLLAEASEGTPIERSSCTRFTDVSPVDAYRLRVHLAFMHGVYPSSTAPLAELVDTHLRLLGGGS